MTRAFSFAALTGWMLALACGDAMAASEAGLERVADVEERRVEVGVVEAVNPVNRMVTIRAIGRDEVIVMQVVGAVRNLEQVEVGDRVVVEYQEALAVDLKRGGGLEPGTRAAAGVARAAPGEKPGGGVAGEATLVATVVGIDRDEPSITLQGPKGDITEIEVADGARLQDVAVGDQLMVTYQQAVAVSVQPSPVGRDPAYVHRTDFVTAAFDMADLDGDGYLTESEVAQDMAAGFAGLDEDHDAELEPAELEAGDTPLIEALDANADDEVTFDEVMARKQREFQAADRDGDGRLSRQEVLDYQVAD